MKVHLHINANSKQTQYQLLKLLTKNTSNYIIYSLIVYNKFIISKQLITLVVINMKQIDPSHIDQLIAKVHNGDLKSYNELFPIVYTELRQIAHRIRFQFYGLNTLNTTALVHESYLKLLQSNASWENKAHFSAVAAKVMRQILLNAARQKYTSKRGGEVEKLPIEEWENSIVLSDKSADEIIALDNALNLLARKSELQSRLVECRFFANMSIEETALVLKTSPSTVKRNWKTTKTWLFSQIQQESIQ
ncbi:MAG: RNA polymerase sigma factor (TIGR02999 family) [Marivirga sp.]